jgi:hypothetical protein
MSDSVPLYEKILSENIEKGSQLRLVVNEFRDVQYLHIRKYFLSYEGEWCPTKEGASMPATISSIYALLDGLIEICSFEESADAITQHFADKIKALNEQTTSVSN